MDLLQWLFDAKLELAGGQFILWREVLGNVFGLLSALGGMRRKVWAWPIGIVGNLLLLTVFLGTVFGSPPASIDLYGQAGRQVMFIATSVYGWVRWKQAKDAGGTAVEPQWASWGNPGSAGRGHGGRHRPAHAPSSVRSAPMSRSGPTPGSSWARCWRPSAWPRAGWSSG